MGARARVRARPRAEAVSAAGGLARRSAARGQPMGATSAVRYSESTGVHRLGAKTRAYEGMEVVHFGFDFMLPPQSSSRRIHALLLGHAKSYDLPNLLDGGGGGGGGGGGWGF